ncbi:hypothetical protein F909_04062 [Acinetobacter sp. ANC 3929]|uniref:hypothetical protein n=1 Tax=Acinetobacter sp. ANC 3929 TaxID=1217707 RepID=UPI0002CE381A|nr:hypothetical protein [Acinetobacter sp. ANC 3929]ENW78373.1 hypothetical protein F909_04062 [Acinetobacter sp. ANC 3929]
MNAQVNELQVLEQNVIVAAFSKVGGTDELYERIAQEVRSHVPDVSTKKGRDAIGSLALKISKSKTLIEKCGKDLVAEQKAQIKLIDDDRIGVVKKFDLLRDEILAPRDAWEKAEEDRVAKHQHNIKEIRLHATEGFLELTTAEMLAGAIGLVEEVIIDSSFEEFEQEAKIAKLETLEKLRSAIAAREKYEAEQAELERLRKAEQECLQREHEERIAKEAADKARIEAEAKALAEKQRLEREQKEQAELAERQQREAAEREARLQAEKEAALLREEQLKQQAIEQAKQAEIQKQQAIEAERLRMEQEQAAKAEAERQAELARQANQAHKKKICNEALKGLLALGVDEAKGKEILQAINKGLVPHVSIKF